MSVSARGLIPPALVDHLKVLASRRRHGAAAYIRSAGVSPSALLGAGVGIAEGVTINAGVSIGAQTYINHGAIIFSGSIGKYCSIAHYCQVGPEQHPIDHVSTSPRVYQVTGFDEFPQPPVIGNDVWLGSHSVILQGVTVGHGAIVAAGAVVTKDVAPYVIVGGVPARALRSRFTSELVDYLLELRWWDDPARLADLASAGADWPIRLPATVDLIARTAPWPSR